MQRLLNSGARDMRPTLFLTVGLPGSGKTTRAVQLETQHNALRLSLDTWMIPIFEGVNEDRSRDLLEGQVISLALQALRYGTNVVLDFGLWSRNERSALRYLATTVGANSEVVYLAVDRETQFQRVTARYETTPEQTFPMTQEQLDEWRSYFETPDQAELTGTVLDEPPADFATWLAWASTRWPSFSGTQTPKIYQQGTASTLTLFCGLPGSGKTTLAKQLEANGSGVRICTDDWQAQLDVADAEFHERLQIRLYECALDLLRHGVDVILEDGLWMRIEREQKFNDARAVGARIEFHVFDVPVKTLWTRLQRRNEKGVLGAYRMTFDQLQRAASLFEPPTSEELSAVDIHTVHSFEASREARSSTGQSR